VGALEAGLTPLAVFEASLSPVPCQGRTHAAFGDHKQGSLRAPKADAVGSYGCAAHDGTKRAQVELGDERVEAGGSGSLWLSFSLFFVMVIKTEKGNVGLQPLVPWQRTAHFSASVFFLSLVAQGLRVQPSPGLGELPSFF